MNNITLFRPTGPKEYKLIEDSGFKKFPPRLTSQPIFYPVCNQDYAEEISQWNVLTDGIGYVLAFDLPAEYLKNYDVQTVGSYLHKEYWIPAEDLEDLNKNIIGDIRLVKVFNK